MGATNIPPKLDSTRLSQTKLGLWAESSKASKEVAFERYANMAHDRQSSDINGNPGHLGCLSDMGIQDIWVAFLTWQSRQSSLGNRSNMSRCLSERSAEGCTVHIATSPQGWPLIDGNPRFAQKVKLRSELQWPRPRNHRQCCRILLGSSP
ncbi:hypothetical protein IAQ61_011470 [Plenodomus lingam]|uniref:uncharacterized protein n=1 Tax=Leptosphaeria maculans TaxID=5022 RepID=UPI0033335B93|nr:hypothetical protein IAQ61_011470 [Plenodomus lingam]